MNNLTFSQLRLKLLNDLCKFFLLLDYCFNLYVVLTLWTKDGKNNTIKICVLARSSKGYLYFLDWTFFPILAQYVLHTFVNSMDSQTNTDHDWNYNEWSKQSIWTEYKAHSYLTYILFGDRQNANLFEVFGSNEYFAEQWVWFMK